MKRTSHLLTAIAAALLATGAAQAQVQTDTPVSPASPTMPAEVQPSMPPAMEKAPRALAPDPTDRPISETTTNTARDDLRNQRRAAATELKRTAREAAAAQRAAMAGRVGGELSTPQQDRGGLAGLGMEAVPPGSTMPQ